MSPGVVCGAEAGHLAVHMPGVEQGQRAVIINAIGAHCGRGPSLIVDHLISRIQRTPVRGDTDIVAVERRAGVAHLEGEIVLAEGDMVEALAAAHGVGAEKGVIIICLIHDEPYTSSPTGHSS